MNPVIKGIHLRGLYLLPVVSPAQERGKVQTGWYISEDALERSVEQDICFRGEDLNACAKAMAPSAVRE